MSRVGEKTELMLHCHDEKEKAWLVSDDGKRSNAKWLPKSEVERGEERRKGSNIYEFVVPEWLARKEGFV